MWPSVRLWRDAAASTDTHPVSACTGAQLDPGRRHRQAGFGIDHRQLQCSPGFPVNRLDSGLSVSARIPAIAPFSQGHADFPQIATLGRQTILVARRSILIADALDDPAALEMLQPSG